ncbi:MAG TPA: ABC transporter permease [Vicinamibacterales bacterium]|nr:ABC transporter permease [Vicinamibacterales bacterium]
MGTLLRIGWINFRRDRVALSLTFVLPVIFFSIFAGVFGNQRNPATRRVPIAVVDEDDSEYSKALLAALQAEGALRVRTTAGQDGKGDVLNRASAEKLIRDGALSVAVVLPKGFGASRKFWSDGSSAAPKVQILADVSDPIAPQVVQGLLQKVSFTAAPETMAVEGLAMFEKYSGPMTPQQRASVDQWVTELRKGAPSTTGGQAGGGGQSAGGMAAAFGVPIELVNVLQPGGGDTATVSFYAAGIGVMFLLFSCAGAGGSLIEEQESGTLARLIGSRAGMSGVLAGKWVFITMMGMLQLTVMFTWGALIFGLPLLPHLPGFFVMTAFTAAAAAGFGLVLATVSRTRAQLSGLSTIVILTMSALGGSMFPRFLMSETMQKAGLVTFNAWALDGYLKVFWRNSPLVDLWPQAIVLTGLTAVLLTLARTLARRWETL